MVDEDDDEVDPFTVNGPLAEISPAEFEEFVVELIGTMAPEVSDLDVRLHDKIAAPDGTYDSAGWHYAPYEDSMVKSVVSTELPDRVLAMLIPDQPTGQ